MTVDAQAAEESAAALEAHLPLALAEDDLLPALGLELYLADHDLLLVLGERLVPQQHEAERLVLRGLRLELHARQELLVEGEEVGVVGGCGHSLSFER